MIFCACACTCACMYLCLCACFFVCICICLCAYALACLRTCMLVCVCVSMCVCMCARVCLYASVQQNKKMRSRSCCIVTWHFRQVDFANCYIGGAVLSGVCVCSSYFYFWLCMLYKITLPFWFLSCEKAISHLTPFKFWFVSCFFQLFLSLVIIRDVHMKKLGLPCAPSWLRRVYLWSALLTMRWELEIRTKESKPP